MSSAEMLQQAGNSLYGATFSDLQQVAFVTFVVSLILFTLASNAFLIYAISKFPPLNNPSNQLIVSFAISDLLCAIFVMPVAGYYNVVGVWHFGKGGCQAYLFTCLLLCASSVYHLCAIAIDQCRAVADPATYARNRSKKKSQRISCVVWTLGFLIVAILFGSPWGMEWPEVFQEDTPCVFVLDVPNATFVLVTLNVAPLLILLITYAKLYQINRKRHRKKIRREAEVIELRQLAGQANRRNPEEKSEEAQTSHSDTGEQGLKKPHSIEDQEEVTRQRGGHHDEAEQQELEEEEDGSGEGGVGHDVEVPGSAEEEVEKRGIERPEVKEKKKEEEEEKRVGYYDIVAVEEAVVGEEEEGGNVAAEEFAVTSPGQLQRFFVKGSRRRQRMLPTDVDVKKFESRCFHCQAVMRRSSDLCQVCSASTNLITAAERARLEILLQRERRAASVMVIVVCVFVVCWSPGLTCLIVPAFYPGVSFDPWVQSFTGWLTFANSACSPVIYILFRSDFKEALMKKAR